MTNYISKNPMNGYNYGSINNLAQKWYDQLGEERKTEIIEKFSEPIDINDIRFVFLREEKPGKDFDLLNQMASYFIDNGELLASTRFSAEFKKIEAADVLEIVFNREHEYKTFRFVRVEGVDVFDFVVSDYNFEDTHSTDFEVLHNPKNIFEAIDLLNYYYWKFRVEDHFNPFYSNPKEELSRKIIVKHNHSWISWSNPLTYSTGGQSDAIDFESVENADITINDEKLDGAEIFEIVTYKQKIK